ncbi:MAG: NAD(P)-dependent oxidoreductase [Bacteroidota bacterium]
MDILIVDKVHNILIEKLQKESFHLDYRYDISGEEAFEIIHKYDGIIIRSKFSLSKEFLSRAKKLKFIGRVGAGLENIDLSFAKENGIVCLNSPEGNRNAVGEQTLGMLLSLMNNLNKADIEVKNGLWRREENRGHELTNKTIGIIGYGNMGSAFAEKLKGFGNNIIAYDKYKNNFSDKYVKEVKLETIYDETDVLSLHVPLTDETYYMVDNDFIQHFRNPFWLINTARGSVINTRHIVENLKKGKIKGAALDVLELEKANFEELHQSEKLPEYFQQLIQMHNVILSPHIAGWTHESNRKLSEVMADKIIHHF